jgi:hypothetical protein
VALLSACLHAGAVISSQLAVVLRFTKVPATNVPSQVKPECAEDFENVWKNRESHLKEMPGFVRFALLKCEYLYESSTLLYMLHPTRSTTVGDQQSADCSSR